MSIRSSYQNMKSPKTPKGQSHLNMTLAFRNGSNLNNALNSVRARCQTIPISLRQAAKWFPVRALSAAEWGALAG